MTDIDNASAPAAISSSAGEAEPQNALTQQFTDAEWKALKDIRVWPREIKSSKC
jgi:hypothetical protein